MRLLDAILLALSVGFLVIGIHQTMVLGWERAYWVFMMSVGCLLWYKFRKGQSRVTPTTGKSASPQKSKRKK